MADHYISVSGSNTSPYDTWAKAASSTTTGLADAITAGAAGDRYFMDKTMTISNSTAQTVTFKGTVANPDQFYSVTNTGSPAVAADLATGAAFTTTGASSITFVGSVYIYGLAVNVGTGTSAASLNILNNSTGGTQTWDTCTLSLKVTTATCGIGIGGGSANVSYDCTWINTTTSWAGGANSSMNINGGRLNWRNTASAVGGGTSINALFGNFGGSSRCSMFLLEGVDLLGVASGKNIFGTISGPSVAQILNCRLASGVVVASTPTGMGASVDLINSDSTATGYRQERYQYPGTLTTSTSVYNIASDGVNPISWQVATNGNAKRQQPFDCFDINQWVAAGTYANCTIQCTSATGSLTNADIWVELEYITGTTPLGAKVSSGTATLLTTGSSLAAGTWAVGGLGNNYSLAIPSFTQAIDGYVRARVRVGKASLTVNVDPFLNVVP